jgi:hypothetical protein
MPSGIGLPDGTLVASGRTEYQTPVFKEEIHFSEGNTPISVYGSPSGAYMTTGRWPASYRNPQRYRDAGFLNLDPSQISQDATAVSIELYFESNTTDDRFSLPVEVSLSALTEPWFQGAEIFGTSSTLKTWPAAVVITTGQVSKSGVWVSFDITDAVKNWQAKPEANFGFMVAGGTGTDYSVWFYTNQDKDHPPRLLITR